MAELAIREEVKDLKKIANAAAAARRKSESEAKNKL